MDKVNILGFLRNIELAKSNVSSTNGFLANHLSKTGCVSHIYDVALNKYYDKFYLARNFFPNKKVWGFKFTTDLGRKSAMSKNACRFADDNQMLNERNKVNAILQIGSEFSLASSLFCENLPKFSYHDNNIMAYLKSDHRINMTGKLNRRVAVTREYESNIYKNMAGIFTMTEILRDSFIEDFGIAEEKVHCIGFGCNIDSTERIDKDYSKDILLFIAKDSFEEKGGRLVVEAFRDIKKIKKDAKLYLVGQDINVDEDDVIVVGFLDKRNESDYKQLIDLYRKATLYVMPSYVEAVGNVFIEAMSFQLPCIGADVSAMPEIIEGNKCGVVVSPGSVSDLTQAILSILEDKKLQKIYGDNGYVAVTEHYNWDNVTSKALAIIKRYV